MDLNDSIAEAKFSTGEIVFEKMRPRQRLIIRNYLDQLYYCNAFEAPDRKPLVFLERDLIRDE
jgi:hypothetical protein